MMTPTNPADELAEIRAEIARLKRREAELRMAFFTAPDMPKIGRMHKVELVTRRRTVFEARLLPAEIRNDPTYIRERVMRVLRTERIPNAERPPMTATTADPLADLRPKPRKRLFAGLTLH